MSKSPLLPDWTDLRNISMPDVKIDLTDPNNLSNKVLSEQESRRRILTHARIVGCERDMLLLFSKFDKLMRNCTNDKERADMSKLACVETYKLLGGGGELYVNNQLVCKDN
jgi:hypothetical protein